MTALDVLPGLDITDVASTSQWRLETLQVANWGGFSSINTLRVDRESTLLSGQSGTGKSTLLDAYLALMMPGTTAFNGASNDAGGGRARGQEQRSLLSYLRGQIDTTTDESRQSKAKVTRGHKEPTWGGIVGQFIDDGGRRFSVARLYYVPASATSDVAIVKRLVTMERVLDLEAVIPLANNRFQPNELESAFPSLTAHKGYGEFAEKFCKRLGIGTGGDGKTALKLLARIQAGRQISTVDDLYKSMVLEEPSTFVAADQALAHFDELDGTYQRMVTEQDKAQRLSPLPGHHERLLVAQSTLEQVSAIGLDAIGLSPLTVWETAQEAAMVTDAETIAMQRTTATALELRVAVAQVDEATVAQRDALTAYNAGGGDRIAQLDQSIAAAEQERARQEGRLATLIAKTSPLNTDIAALDTDAYSALVTAGTEFLEQAEAKEAALQERFGPLAADAVNARNRQEDLEKELKDAKARPGRVPASLDRQRMQVCEATGMTREDLPFVAELLDIPASQERWRTAIEVTLGGVTSRMVVPQDRIREVSATVDRMPWTTRMGFDAVPVDLPRAPKQNPASVAGKLEVAESKFAGWVSQRVSSPKLNALCVETAEDLQGQGMRVSLSGQSRNGNRYAHGRSAKDRNIIGFDNTGAVAELEADLAAAELERTAARHAYDAVTGEQQSLRHLTSAHDAIVQGSFQDVDVRGSDTLLTSLRTDRENLLTADDALAALKERLGEAERELQERTKVAGGLETQRELLATEWKKLVTRTDQLTKAHIGHEEVGEIDAKPLARLEAWWNEATTTETRQSLSDWPVNRKMLREKLKTEQGAASAALEVATGEIQAILVSYQRAHYDPNLGTTVDGVGDYLEIYDEIQATGLAARSQEWRDRLLRWSGEDLVPLTQAMTEAIVDINARLDPINRILHKLPFGPLNRRLYIDLRPTPDATVLDFRRQLSALSSGATRDLDLEQMRERFEELKQFMALVRSPNDPRVDLNVANREHLLDVRRHVHVTAQCLDGEGVESIFDSLGGKSGGETQELIAFIVGAALRYRLGDQLRDRPQFAPVFLDEAFIKADAEFSGRAVKAWLGLGFQLVVGAPTDKVSALEPHMRALVSITKNHVSNESFLTHLTDVDRTPPGAGEDTP